MIETIVKFAPGLAIYLWKFVRVNRKIDDLAPDRPLK